METITKAVLIKIGGSALDAEFDEPMTEYLIRTLPFLSELTKEYGVVIAPGGGPSWDVRKNWRDKYGTSKPLFEVLAFETLRHNALEITDVLESNGARVKLIHPHQFEMIERCFSSREIAVVYCAPDHVIRKFAFDPVYSDVQTLAIAETIAQSFEAEVCIFMKRTKGIFRWEEGLSSKAITALLDEKYLKPDAREQLEALQSIQAVEENCFLRSIPASLVCPPGVFTVGTDGKVDHLIEQDAIRFFLTRAERVERVAIADVSQPSMLLEIMRGASPRPGFSFIEKR
jgi:uridylate kinase